MKTIVLLLLFPGTFLGAQLQPITRESLEGTIFESIRAQPGEPPQLVMKFSNDGARFLLFRNGNEEKVNEYGETISVKLGESLGLTEHHGGLEFLPLPKPLDKNGWLLKSDADARSFGGTLSTQYAIVLILNGSELRFIEPDQNFNPQLPPTDPTYERIIKLIEQETPLSSHSLFAETPSGKTNKPFPNSATKIVFEWMLRKGASGDAIEARWIAADTGGAAPRDHVIATASSAPGKTKGEFTLSKPTQGFPPGNYRIELRQNGKLVHTEAFEIKNSR